MYHSKTILTVALLLFSTADIKGITLPNALTMHSVERENFLSSASIEDLQDLKVAISNERATIAMQLDKYKRRAEIGRHHSITSQIVGMTSYAALIASLFSVGYIVNERLPVGFKSMPIEPAFNMVFDNIGAVREHPVAYMLIGSLAANVASLIYMGISGGFTEYNKKMIMRSLEKLVALYNLEEVVNSFLLRFSSFEEQVS